MDSEKFAQFIKSLRVEKGLTQKELGDKLNITDKAISKWERGLSFPDISMLNTLAEFFNIDVSELLNGERGVKKYADVDALVKEAIDAYKNIEEKRKQKIERIKRIVGIVSLVIFILSLLLQLAYLFILKKHGYEYVIDILFYIVTLVIIFSFTLSINYFFLRLGKVEDKHKKINITKKVIRIASISLCGFLSAITIIFMCRNGFSNKCIVSFSKNLSNELVLKIDKDSGGIKLYRNIKMVLFAKEREQFDYEIDGVIKKQWLTNDICSLTYLDKDNNLRECVVTYGDRGDGVAYYYVTSALKGEWQTYSQYGSVTKVLVDSKGVTVTMEDKQELFDYKNCKQFGTIALVLYKNDVPEYVIALDENCKIDDNSSVISKGGTITLTEVSMDKTKLYSLYCMNYKDEDLSDYNVVSVGKNDYKIKNGILYISYDGSHVIEVPGDFSDIDGFDDYTYQINEEKTFFCYTKDGEKYLLYSDDMGSTWNTTKLESDLSVQSIQFLDKNTGFMLTFSDVVAGSASGKISKTTDGGKNWVDIANRTFSRASQILFVSEDVGFLTMPKVTGEYSDLYITRDGGNSFEKLELLDSDIYDYYNIPSVQDNKIYIEISQGSDGDYSGGDSKIYSSDDEGVSFKLEE